MSSEPILKRSDASKACLAAKNRRGSLLVEAVIAIALFGTAAVALSQLSQTSAALNLKGDQRLSAQLTAQNVLEMLQHTNFNELNSRIPEIESTAAKQSTWDVAVRSETFEIGDQDAMHIVVHVTQPNTQAKMITLHDWRIRKSDSDGNSDSNKEHGQ